MTEQEDVTIGRPYSHISHVRPTHDEAAEQNVRKKIKALFALGDAPVVVVRDFFSPGSIMLTIGQWIARAIAAGEPDLIATAPRAINSREKHRRLRDALLPAGLTIDHVQGQRYCLSVDTDAFAWGDVAVMAGTTLDHLKKQRTAASGVRSGLAIDLYIVANCHVRRRTADGDLLTVITRDTLERLWSRLQKYRNLLEFSPLNNALNELQSAGVLKSFSGETNRLHITIRERPSASADITSRKSSIAQRWASMAHYAWAAAHFGHNVPVIGTMSRADVLLAQAVALVDISHDQTIRREERPRLIKHRTKQWAEYLRLAGEASIGSVDRCVQGRSSDQSSLGVRCLQAGIPLVENGQENSRISQQERTANKTYSRTAIQKAPEIRIDPRPQACTIGAPIMAIESFQAAFAAELNIAPTSPWILGIRAVRQTAQRELTIVTTVAPLTVATIKKYPQWERVAREILGLEPHERLLLAEESRPIDLDPETDDLSRMPTIDDERNQHE